MEVYNNHRRSSENGKCISGYVVKFNAKPCIPDVSVSLFVIDSVEINNAFSVMIPRNFIMKTI